MKKVNKVNEVVNDVNAPVSDNKTNAILDILSVVVTSLVGTNVNHKTYIALTTELERLRE